MDATAFHSGGCPALFWLAPEIDSLCERLLGELFSPRAAIDPGQLSPLFLGEVLVLLELPEPRAVLPLLGRRAERELAGVYRCELARLLREGARLSLCSSREEDLARWRELLREELGCACADLLRLPRAASDLLGSCLRGPLPAARTLARAALAFEDSAESRLALAEALRGEGDFTSACAVLAFALRRGAARQTALRIAALLASLLRGSERGELAEVLEREAERLGSPSAPAAPSSRKGVA